MKVRTEIEKYADEADKEILLGLLSKYHWSHQWGFVASCEFRRYGNQSYQVHRVWKPTTEGRILYEHLIAPEAG